ncbi:N-acetylmuramidase domain-containing protein [Shimia sp. MMG029]|uniref:N-acetylmuramidase domain-containing protein n=1 Tax=Shimia sp. MMG029 TaxID=3021978 RepID=UPI0022FE7C2B|nr:N-acetylmuramidase domain-containing protein [Shimia sp. MMG029]MDA5556311.1 N-acetylmuramidase domain-containing protein [Shimia sp. MMG029]
MFAPDVVEEISKIAEELTVEPAALLAVAQVESGGRVFATVDGKDMPLIRWEGHYFHRELPVALRKKAVRAGLASTVVGGVKNSSSQQVRYNLLARAKKLHEVAALRSCSWGLGQVMGANAEWIGYQDVHALVADAVSGAAGQVQVMANFIRRAGLVDELQALNWAAFARQYNGPGYKVNKYDTKMARAYAAFGGSGVVAEPDELVLRTGALGEAVRELQLLLRRAGHGVLIDGDFGPATKRAVMNFQRDNGLGVDGVVGPATWAALEAKTP